MTSPSPAARFTLALVVGLASVSCTGHNNDLERIEVSPTNASIAAGRSQVFNATGVRQNGERVDLSGTVAWSFSDPAIAVADGSTGTGLSPGITTIRAMDSGTGLLGSAELTVTDAQLVSLAVSPQAPQIALGTGVQLTAIGTFSDNTTQDLTTSSTWTTGAELVATVSMGFALSTGVGVATITAIDPATGIDAAVHLDVTTAVLASIAIMPSDPQIALGTGQQLNATGTFSDSTTQDLTSSVTWSSSAPLVASVGNAPAGAGFATSAALGATTIMAADPGSGVNGSTTLTVTAAELVSIDVTPTEPSIALGTEQQFTATGTYTDSTTQDVTDALTWSSSMAAVAPVSNAPGSEGLASSLAAGSTSISAVDPGSGANGSTTLIVTAAELVSIAVTPTNPAIALGTNQQLAATGTYTDSTTQDLTDVVTWSSSMAAVAPVSNAPGSEGLASSLAIGSTTVSAVDPGGGINASTTLAVTTAELVSIEVTPADPSIALGTNQQLVATGTYTDSTTQDLTGVVTWSSSMAAVAPVSNALGSEGLASSLAAGSTSISAVDPGSSVNGSTTLTVTAATLVAVEVTPTDPSIALGTDQLFTATGTYTDSSTQDLTDAVTWSSSMAAVAPVSNAPGSEGLASSLAAGSTSISAVDPGSGVNGSTTLTVTAATLVSVAVTPADLSITTGSTEPLVATGTYTDGSTQDLTTSVTWHSSDMGVATISNAGGSEGLGTAVAAGATTVTATDPGTALLGTTSLDVIADMIVVGADGVASPSALDLDIPVPVGTAGNDVIIAYIAVRPSTATITPPADWILVRRLDNASGITNSLAVYRRTAGAGEPATHRWSLSASTGSAGAIIAFRGVDVQSPIDVESGQSTTSSLTHTAPSVTTTVPRTWLTTAHAFASSATWTPPAGMTEAVDIASNAPEFSAGISLTINFEFRGSAGAAGTRAATASSNPDSGNTHTLVLSP